MLNGRRTALSRWLTCLLAITSLATNPIVAQTQRSGSITPSSWLQLRGGTSNAGVLPGTLETTWRFHALRPVRGAAIAAGLVVIGTESADSDALPDAFAPDQNGFLTALDAFTGRELWSRRVPSWIHGDPVLYHGSVIASFGRWPMTHPGGVIAVDARTGKTLWARSTEAGVMPAPAIDSSRNTVIVVGGDGVVYGLSLTDGSVLYKSGLRAPDAMSSPRIE